MTESKPQSKFKKAEKKKSKLRLGITGPSGSGKTFSALRLAKGIGGKIAFIDTERGSASLYADRFEFDVLDLTAPYTTEKYIEAMRDAYQAGYQVLIIDSLSHAWAGEGGLLQQKEQIDATGKGNSYTNWAKVTPKQERLISAIHNVPMHLIVTMRSKQEYIQFESGGKKHVQKVGMAPIQRDGFEYELTTVFDVSINHEAETSKDRTGLFTDKIFQITEDTGKEIVSWLEGGNELLPPEPLKTTLNPPQSDAKKAPKKEPDAGVGKTPQPITNEPPPWAEKKKELEAQKEKVDAAVNTQAKSDPIKGSTKKPIENHGSHENLAVYNYVIPQGSGLGGFIGMKLHQINDADLKRVHIKLQELRLKHDNKVPLPVQEAYQNVDRYMQLKQLIED